MTLRKWTSRLMPMLQSFLSGITACFTMLQIQILSEKGGLRVGKWRGQRAPGWPGVQQGQDCVTYLDRESVKLGDSGEGRELLAGLKSRGF